MTIIDACFGAVTTKSLTNIPITLTITEAQSNLLRFTGTLTGNIEVTLPAIIKGWSVQNLCTGNFYVRLNTGSQAVCAPPGEIVDILSDGTNLSYRDLGRVGSYLDYAGASVPIWISNCGVPPYLNCDGSTYSSVTYPALFAILGTTTLPDKRGRQGIALNQGTGRVTTANGGVDGDTRFATGGNPNRVVAAGELPATQISISGNVSVSSTVSDVLRNPSGTNVTPGAGSNGVGSGVNGSGGYRIDSTGTITSGSTANLGNGDTHINMDPTLVYGITMIRSA
jgi:microcystin-dependent protein